MLKKSIALLSLLVLLFACTSEFPSHLDKDKFVDDEGNPIVDPDEISEEQEFGIENSYCYGFSTPENEEIAIIDIPNDLPNTIDLSEFLPPVGNQGKQGSCVGWATGYYLKSFQENFQKVQDGLSADLQMSPAFVYNQIKIGSCAGGSQILSALELITEVGIVSLEEMPYDENECEVQPTEIQNNLAEINKVKSYAYLDGAQLFDQTKAFLANNQPIVIAISIDRNYFGATENNGDAVYRNFKKADGAHAMLVVGYDDDKNAFKVVNSWGKNWGNNGFVWIDYKAFKEVNDTNSTFKILCEAWVSEDIIPISS